MAVIIIILGFEYRRVLDGVRYFSNKVPIERIYLVYNRRKDVVGYASRRNLKDLNDVLSFAFKQPIKIGINFSDPTEFFTLLQGLIAENIDFEVAILGDDGSASFRISQILLSTNSATGPEQSRGVRPMPDGNRMPHPQI